MSRLTKRGKQKKLKKLLRYKWEFIRRNKEYIADYNKLRRLGRVLTPAYKLTSTGRSIYKKWYKQQCLILRKWGFAPNDPSKPRIKVASSWMNMISEQHKQPVVSHTLLLPSRRDRTDKVYGLTFGLFDRIQITLDLCFPKEEMLDAIEDVISIYQDPRKTGISTKRTLESQYKQYLAIYDLRQRRTTWKKIALKTYPNDKDIDIDSYIKKVKRNYKACVDLINNHWKIR